MCSKPEAVWRFLRRGLPLWAIVCLLASGHAVVAQEASVRRPEGLVVGPLYLAPFLVLSVEEEDNVFRRGDQDERGVESDRVARTMAGLSAILPLGHSRFRLAYSATSIDYQRTVRLERELAQDFDAGLELNFPSRERLRVRAQVTRGVSDVQRIDEGGEFVFDGRPYTIKERRFELSRRVPGRPGYSVELSRDEFRFDTADTVTFFDFDGIEGEATYHHPVSRHSWFTAAYSTRRADHHREPFRRERRDAVRLGLTGELGRGQPITLNAGVEALKYEGDAATQYRGGVGSVSWAPRVGPAGRLVLGLQRRALPSFFDTYYLVNEATVAVERSWPRGTKVGIRLRGSANRYGDALDWEHRCPGISAAECPFSFRRKDELQRAEVFFDWVPQRRLAFRISAVHERRDSNFSRAEFRNTVLGLGMLVGWYE